MITRLERIYKKMKQAKPGLLFWKGDTCRTLGFSVPNPPSIKSKSRNYAISSLPPAALPMCHGQTFEKVGAKLFIALRSPGFYKSFCGGAGGGFREKSPRNLITSKPGA